MKSDAERAAEAARKAQALLDAARPASNDHPYAARKLLTLPATVREIDLADAIQINGYAPAGGKNREPLEGPTVLVVPVYVDGTLSTVEMIDGDRRKSFLAGGRTTGGYWTTAELPDCDWIGDLTIIIGEGVATVLSASIATGYIGVAAMSCGNLLAVAKMLRGRYPDAKIIFIADLGIGVTKSTEAARAVAGLVATPKFPEGAKGKDVNDLHVACGLPAVKACVDGATEPAAEAVATAPEPEAASRPINSDRGHARRLWAAVKDDCHYVAERKKFCFYNGDLGTHEMDATGGRILAACVAITKQLVSEALAADDKDERKRLLDEARASEGLRFMKNAIELLPSMPGMVISSSIFDANPNLLNFRNVVYDLDRDVFREHRREDYLTLGLPYDFDPAALCPRLKQAIAEIWPDIETQKFMQLWFGYCLSGSTEEQAFLFVWGTGANGKSVIAKLLVMLLGPYAVQCSIDLFTDSDDVSATRKTIPLQAKRLAICSETRPGQYLNENLMKSIVSPDIQVGRRLYCEEESWEGTAKVMILGNHLLRTRGGDYATDRRVRLVGCEQRFEGDHCDPDLLEKLTAELPGVMNWAIEGYRKWKAHGLGMPAKVKEDTANYCAENDTLREFFEPCVVSPAASVGRKALYQAHLDWSKAQGNEHHLSPRSFAAKVQERGFRAGPKTRIGGDQDRTWLGIGLPGSDPGHRGTPRQEKRELFSNAPAREDFRDTVPRSASVPQEADALDPLAALDNCLRVRPGTTASDSDRAALVEHFRGLNGTADAAGQRMWAYWRAAPCPTVGEFLAREPARKGGAA